MQHQRVWLIGGTSDSARLARALLARSVPFVVTVTTSSAQALYPVGTAVQVGRLDCSLMASFIAQWAVRCVLDASHPFAVEVSKQAIALCQQRAISYLRYERSALSSSALSASAIASSEPFSDDALIEEVDSIEALVKSDILQGQRVLFTLGYRTLDRFAALRASAQLFARVLPSAEAIDGALQAGFSAREIIALRPPISTVLEAALWQHWGITCVVAKASGQPGGEDTKRQLAKQLGVRLVLIQRPQLKYPAQTNVVKSAVDFCVKTLSLY